MRSTVITHLSLILNTSKLKIEMQIEMKLYIFLSVKQLRQIATLKHKLRWEKGLLNASLAGVRIWSGCLRCPCRRCSRGSSWGCWCPPSRASWRQLHKNRSSRKINSRILLSREWDFQKTLSLTERQYSGKTYFYTIHASADVLGNAVGPVPSETVRSGFKI